jgi:D-glycero-alpha-D-manno-heptose 1-phosphate guanylyltransferase
VIAAVLAGGLGTRLRPVLPNRAKALAEIGETPFLELVLAQLKAEGIAEVVLCTGYLGHQIRSQFGENWGGLRILYSEEPEPCGTAGALRLALPFFGAQPLLVMNGDSFYRDSLSPLLDCHRRNRARATILLSRVADCRRFGRVEATKNDKISGFVEKDPAYAGPAWVSAGVYVIEPEVVRNIPEKRQVSLEKEVFPNLIGRGLYGYRGTGEFLDIGTPESYAQAREFFSQNRPKRQAARRAGQ